MAGSTISSHVTIAVTLGSASYPNPLTVTSAGFIDPSASSLHGATALVATISGGSVLNLGTIAGDRGAADTSIIEGAGGAGVSLSTTSTLTNLGLVSGGDGGGGYYGGPGGGPEIDGGAGAAGIRMTDGSSLTNSGSIAGGNGGAGGVGHVSGNGGDGVDVNASSLTNSGTISGGVGGYGSHFGGTSGDAGAGVSLQAGGVLTNHGLIVGGLGGSRAGLEGPYYYGGGTGVDATNSSLTGDGTIAGGGASGTGVNLNGSTFTNNGSVMGGRALGIGLDNGGTGVVALNSTLTNNATITAGYGYHGGVGVMLTSSILTNNGVIDGGRSGYGGTGVYVTTSVLINTGSISGGDNIFGVNGNSGGVGVLFHGGGTLTDSGFISGGTGTSGIVDAINFGTGTARLIVDPGAVFVGDVVADGSSTTLELASAASTGMITGIGTSFTGFGSIVADADATWVITASAVGSGTVSLDAGSRLTFDAGVAATLPVDFTAASGTLGLADPAAFAATVFGLQRGDAVDFTSITSTGSIIAGVNGSNDLTLTSNGTLLTEIKLDPSQDFSGVLFQAAPDGSTGTVVTEAQPVCFLAGTMIATPTGETPVEKLRVGDMVLTAWGAARPVVWIGTGQVLATRGRRSAATPVVVRKGALADNVPHRDLRITKAHALCVDGVLIPVEFLINHRSIHWDDMAQEVALYHVELETHDVLVADGAPAESFRDDGNRWLFHNADSGWHLPAKPPCAPVLTGGDVVDAVWLRLLQRMGQRPGVPLTDDPDLHLRVDGRRIDATSRTNGFHVFCLPTTPDEARIVSRAAVPQELGLTRDPRDLGVALRRIIIREGVRSRIIRGDDKLLADGFHEYEASDGFRWTNGDAVLPAPLFSCFEGPLEVVLHCGGVTRYVDDRAARHAA